MAASDGAARKLAFVKDRLDAIARRAAEAYLGRLQGQGDPIVDRRFRGEGNARFAPLKPSTLKAKAGFIGRERAAGRVGKVFGADTWKAAAGKTGSRLVGGNLPILVGVDRYNKAGQLVHQGGTLRQAVSLNKSLQVIKSVMKGVAIILFRGQPDYAKHLHTGTPKMVKRSPYDPDANDRKAMVAAVKAWLLTELRKVQAMAPGAPAAPPSAGQFGPPRVIGPIPPGAPIL